MAKFGKVDYKAFLNLQKKFEQFDKIESQKICEKSAKELGGRLLAKAKKKTPVGDYSKIIKVTAKRNSKRHKKGDVYTKRVNPSGKKGGTLKRNWTIASHSLSNGYEVDVINATEYAAYVEFGHRTRGHKGFVPGRHMLTRSEIEVEKQMDKVIEKYMMEALGGLFDDK